MQRRASQPAVKWWVHLLIGIVVYIGGNIAFMMGAIVGTPQDILYKEAVGLRFAYFIFPFLGVPLGLPALVVHVILTNLLSMGDGITLLPIQRVLASAILAGVIAFTAGYLWW
jgi:hypothetical protein